MIISHKNEKIKLISSLKQKKYREEARLFFIEGHKFVLEGLASFTNVETIATSETYMKSQAYKELLEFALMHSINLDDRLLKLTDNVFSKISDTNTPQGIIGVFPLPENDIKDLGDYTKLILLENLQDPGNLGTLIRTADAAGFDGVVYGRGTVDSYNPKAVRSSAGSIFHIDIFDLDMETNDIAKLLKEKGFSLYGSHLRGRVKSFDLEFARRTVIVIGNEARGMTDDLSNLCDYLTYIPMVGKAESLNASVAASLMIYEVMRKEKNI